MEDIREDNREGGGAGEDTGKETGQHYTHLIPSDSHNYHDEA